jgi:hypothetical protein
MKFHLSPIKGAVKMTKMLYAVRWLIVIGIVLLWTATPVKLLE